MIGDERNAQREILKEGRRRSRKKEMEKHYVQQYNRNVLRSLLHVNMSILHKKVQLIKYTRYTRV